MSTIATIPIADAYQYINIIELVVDMINVISIGQKLKLKELNHEDIVGYRWFFNEKIKTFLSERKYILNVHKNGFQVSLEFVFEDEDDAIIFKMKF